MYIFSSFYFVIFVFFLPFFRRSGSVRRGWPFLRLYISFWTFYIYMSRNVEKCLVCSMLYCPLDLPPTQNEERFFLNSSFFFIIIIISFCYGKQEREGEIV